MRPYILLKRLIYNFNSNALIATRSDIDSNTFSKIELFYQNNIV